VAELFMSDVPTPAAVYEDAYFKWYFTVREKQRLRVFENRVLSKYEQSGKF
jgi:hypothetical protein